MWLLDLCCNSGVMTVVLQYVGNCILPCIGVKVQPSNRFHAVRLQNIKVLDIRVPRAHSFSLLYPHTEQPLTKCKQACQNARKREVFSYLLLIGTELTDIKHRKQLLKV